jgi:hypothetical protein
VLIECAPLDHVCFEDIVNLGHELEGESLDECVSKVPVWSIRQDDQTFKMVVAGMQCVSKS